MPGRGKRRRRQEAERERVAARTAPGVGRWEVVFETEDSAEMRLRVRQLQEAGTHASMIRIDTLCGRLTYPSGYRLSRFVTDPASGSDRGSADN